MFDCTLKTEPGSERNPPYKFIGDPGEIEDDQSETAALQDEVSGFEYVLKRVVGCWSLVVG